MFNPHKILPKSLNIMKIIFSYYHKRILGVMKRKTITLDDVLYETIQKIRAGLISNGIDMSFTTTVNVVLTCGILGSEKFDEEIWKEIADFFSGNPEEDIESIIDNYTEFLVQRLKKIRDIHTL